MVATAGTKPEIRLASEFRRRRFRLETNVDSLPGRPDLVLPRHKVAVFVHGCFWHGCPKHLRVPKHNRRWWKEKISSNRRRDARKAQQLRRLGWSVYNVWEHEDPVRAVDKISKRIAKRRSP